MFSFIWHTFFFDPIYNGLVIAISIVPGGDVGLAIILLTIVVKTILLPVALKAARTQRAMRAIEPKLKEIQEKYKDKREELARKTMDVYKEAGINPFASIILLFIQIPVIIALYLVFFRGGGGVSLPDINMSLLYSFVTVPEQVSMFFFGSIDVAGKSLIFALLAGITQFFQIHLSLPPAPPKKEGEAPSFKDDFARSMQLQMRYVLPVIIFIVAYTISAAIALYFLVSNIFGIFQELYVKRTVKDTPSVVEEEKSA